MKEQIKVVPCPECQSPSLLRMGGKEGLVAVWSDCSCLNRNSVLAKLREEGWDIGNRLFEKKVKADNRPVKSDLILGKYRDMEALESALFSLADRMGVPVEVVQDQIKKIGLVTAYRRLCHSFGNRKQVLKRKKKG